MSGRLLPIGMDAALGPPEKMAELEEDLTPMMAQYYELCRQYDDAWSSFRSGTSTRPSVRPHSGSPGCVRSR